LNRTLLLVSLALSSAAHAEVFRHGRFEQAFTSSVDYPDPLEATVAAEFQGPGGARGRAAAFWDGGRTWKVRFSPPRAGQWRYRLTSSNTADRGLHGRSGSFRVSEYRGENPLYRHGPPALSANRRHLAHADGKPWLWLADTAWNGALLSTREEWDRYLRDRAAKGFTGVQFVTTQWRAGRRDERGQTAFTAGERLSVNPAFYRRMDERFDTCNDRGIAAIPVLLWALTSKDKESPGESLAVEEAARLARYMVARYGAHHVLWILGGDGDYSGANAAKWKAIGRRVFPEGVPRAPVTLHPRGMRSPWAEYRDEPWVDIFMYQSGHGSNDQKWRWNATQGMAEDWKMEPARPVIDGEINYEAHIDYHDRKPITDAQVRRAAYYSLLAGPPAGVTYGAHGIWFWSRKAEVPLDHPRTGVAEPWHQCLDYPGARQMGVLRQAFDSIEWWKLRPDRGLLAEDPADPTFRRHPMPARAEDNSFALIYLPENPQVRLNLSKFTGRVEGAWIDPRTGGRQPAGRWPASAAVEVRAPGEGDWLLVIRAEQ
jgi:hypothetical protein